MKKLLTMAILLVIGSCCVVVNAQQQAPSLKPSLLLEVVSNPALPPAYSTVNGPNEIGKAIAISNFVRVPGSSESSPPIRMVKVEPQLNGDNVAVRVTLYRGVKGIYQEELVGIYRLGIGETKTLKELRAFGIEPFTVTLLDTVLPLPPPPAFQNDT